MRVVLGAWIATEYKVADGGIAVEEYPQARQANRRQVDTLVRLANAYPDIVLAVTVGNETPGVLVGAQGSNGNPDPLYP